jgi:integrase
MTLGHIADQYLAAKERTLRGSTYDGYVRYFQQHWAPLRSVPINQIDRRMVAARTRELVNGNGTSAAAGALGSLSALFHWSMGEGLVDHNPCIGVNNPKAGHTPRQCVLEDKHIKAIWHACLDDDFGKIVRLLILSGARRDEIGVMKWTEVDLKTGMLVVGTDRVKNKNPLRLPLPAPALAILKTIPRRDGCVFGHPAHGFTSHSHAKHDLDARLSDVSLPDWRLHDLRRTMRSGLGRLGIAPHIAELAINHTKKGMIGVYDHYSYEGEIANALSRWAEHVMSVVEGRKGKIVPLRA